MATISVTSDLDVLSKYEGLVKSSLGSNSVYIRAKETIQELASDGDLKDSEKAKIISEVVASLSGSLANSSMSTALQWAAKEKDVALEKLKLEKTLDILDLDKELKQAQADKIGYESINVQAQTDRMYGTPVVVNGALTSLADEGKVWEEIELLKLEQVNKGKEGTLLDTQVKQSHANIHKVVADTYVNYGAWGYTLSESGLTGVTDNAGTHLSLSEIQAEIAKQQANGYAYNAWANAATSTSSMLGTALAAEITDQTAIDNLVTQIAGVTTKLDGAVAPY